MAKPNYSFEKRQRDIQKQQKKAEKLAKKAAAKEDVANPDAQVTDSMEQALPDHAPKPD